MCPLSGHFPFCDPLLVCELGPNWKIPVWDFVTSSKNPEPKRRSKIWIWILYQSKIPDLQLPWMPLFKLFTSEFLVQKLPESGTLPRVRACFCTVPMLALVPLPIVLVAAIMQQHVILPPVLFLVVACRWDIHLLHLWVLCLLVACHGPLFLCLVLALESCIIPIFIHVYGEALKRKLYENQNLNQLSYFFWVCGWISQQRAQTLKGFGMSCHFFPVG